MSSPASNPPMYPIVRAPKTWFGRNWKWFVPVLCAFAAALLGLFVLGIYFAVTGIMKSNDAYKTAIQRAEQNPVVWEKIGHPFRVGSLISGNVNLNGPSGEADISIPIHGDHGSGHIFVSAKKRAGKWTYEVLEVHVDGDGTVIPLLGAGGGEAAPADDSVWEISSARRVGG